jgi:hypothetical protein
VFDVEHGHGWSTQVVGVQANANKRREPDDDSRSAEYGADDEDALS